jgi:hypothetical protein
MMGAMNANLLVLLGVATTVFFAAVVVVEGARRPGYSPLYHTGSELELGPGGWIQRGNFVLMAAGMSAHAIRAGSLGRHAAQHPAREPSPAARG